MLSTWEVATPPTNEARAGWARKALDAYCQQTRHTDADSLMCGPGGIEEHGEELLSDLLCDLHHLTDALGIPWENVLLRGTGHYVIERLEGGGEI